MLTCDQFEALIQSIREIDRRGKAAYDLGIDYLDLSQVTSEPARILSQFVFRPAQIECMDWWLYDSPNGIKGDPEPDKWAKITEVGTGALMADLTSVKALYDYLLTLEEPQS